jgi:hypothetical protein
MQIMLRQKKRKLHGHQTKGNIQSVLVPRTVLTERKKMLPITDSRFKYFDAFSHTMPDAFALRMQSYLRRAARQRKIK